MKRRNFLGWCAGALVVVRKAFVGDVEAKEPNKHPTANDEIEPLSPLPNAWQEELRAGSNVITVDGVEYIRWLKFASWTNTGSGVMTSSVQHVYTPTTPQGKVSIPNGTQRDS